MFPDWKNFWLIGLNKVGENHGSFMIWFSIEGCYKQDLIFALNAQSGSFASDYNNRRLNGSIF